MNFLDLIWLIPLFPAAGFVINGLFGKRMSKTMVNLFAIGSVALSFAWVVKTLLGLGAIEATGMRLLIGYQPRPLSKPSAWRFVPAFLGV